MRKTRVLLALTLLVVGAAACSTDGAVDVIVDLRTDLVAGDEFDLIRVELRDALPSGTTTGATTRDTEVPAVVSQNFGAGRRVAEFAGVSPGRYNLRVQLFGRSTLRTSRTVSLQVNDARAVTVVITRTCLDVECPAPTGADAEISCLGGECVESSCVTGFEASCGTPGCATSDDCTPGAACTTTVCIEGACFLQPADGECGTDEVCHPALGCTALDTCEPRPETCDDTDEDCDGSVDEDFDLAGDPTNCGACGFICPSGPGAAATCAGGICGVSCDASLGNCDGDPDNGCERDLGTATDCGACGSACPAGEPACSPDGAGGFECVSGCPADTPTLCGTSCVATASDTRHCGGCDATCQNDHGTSDCLSGECVITECDGIYTDCDEDATTGCETPACGGCDMPCSAPNVANYACRSGVCASSSCSPGFGNCDNAFANGCEIDLRTDPAHCGGCRAACDPADGTGSCDAGTFSLVSCDAGFSDCDGDVRTGCEAHFDDDEENCGACGVACGTGETCTGGRCDCYGAAGSVGSGPVCAAGLVCGNLEMTCCVAGCPCSRHPMAPPCPPPL